MNDSSPGANPGHHLQHVDTPDDGTSVTDPPVRNLERHRQRQIQRLAAIQLVLAAYGPSAGGRLVPPGPECCPRTCEWCHPLVVAS
jgi:hypothetical protein